VQRDWFAALALEWMGVWVQRGFKKGDPRILLKKPGGRLPAEGVIQHRKMVSCGEETFSEKAGEFSTEMEEAYRHFFH